MFDIVCRLCVCLRSQLAAEGWLSPSGEARLTQQEWIIFFSTFSSMSRIIEPVSMFSFCGFDAAGPGRLSIVQCVQSSSRWWVNREVLVRLLVIEPSFLLWLVFTQQNHLMACDDISTLALFVDLCQK